MLDDENLPFTEPVRAYAMLDKFKMPRVKKYDGSRDPQSHLEAFREHIVLHGTPDAIACRAFPLDPDRGGEGLVYGTFPEVSRHFQGARTPIPNTVSCHTEEEEECYRLVDSVPGK